MPADTPATIEGVHIEFTGAEGSDRPYDAWRIAWKEDDGSEWVMDVPFGRRRDAEMGLEALARAGYTRQDLIAQTYIPNGEYRDELEKIAISALQW